MDQFCNHESRTFSHEVETEHGRAYLYVCHNCQTGFYSQIPPRRDDLPDADLFPPEDEDFGERMRQDFYRLNTIEEK